MPVVAPNTGNRLNWLVVDINVNRLYSVWKKLKLPVNGNRKSMTGKKKAMSAMYGLYSVASVSDSETRTLLVIFILFLLL